MIKPRKPTMYPDSFQIALGIEMESFCKAKLGMESPAAKPQRPDYLRPIELLPLYDAKPQCAYIFVFG